MFLWSIINKTVLSVDQIGVVPWSLFLWMVWLILHTIYKKFFLMLLQKIKIHEIQQQRLVKIYWTLVFTTITIPFALQNLSLTPNDLNEKFKYVLENKVHSWIYSNQAPSIQTKLSYILLTGFLLNNACEISTEKGFNNIDFFHSELLTVFFVTTFPTKCVLFGIAVTSIVNAVKSLLEMSKLLACVGNITNSKFLSKLAFLILIIHSLIWCAVYLHILPKYFLFHAIKKIKHKSDLTNLSSLSLLNISLWIFYLIDIYKSPLSCLITNYVNGKKCDFEDIVFPASHNYPIEEYDQSDVDTLESEDNYISSKNEESSVEENKDPKENLVVLYQTVKCVIRVKRKLRRIREKLNQNKMKNNGDLVNKN
ncbi:hypothetical protein O3M35_010508 [Rhynocoris fuscipes]|uniref:Uncharacterized protein n=1 Tax=Rhynocoris fuscipes TaxID=488301 RepID=A0AAW1D5A6_9HEMI